MSSEEPVPSPAEPSAATDRPRSASSRVSRASAGGSADAGGVDLQNRVFAWAASFLISEEQLPQTLPVGTVAKIGAQTGAQVDDLAVITSAGNYALFQVKSGLRMDRGEDSPLAKALGQVVSQYLDGDLADGIIGRRALDPARDALVICTNTSAPATIRIHLAKAISRISSHPAGTALSHELSAPEDAALRVALTHIRRLWRGASDDGPSRPAATDEQIRDLLRAVRVLTLDTSDGGADQTDALSQLRSALAGARSTTHAWQVLVAEAQACAVSREWRDRPALSAALARQGIWLEPPARFVTDIGVLNDLAAVNASMLAAGAVLPVEGGLFIEREVSAKLAEAAGQANLLIVGDAGSGKSAVAQHFAHSRSATQQVLLLRAADLVGANRVQLSAPLQVILQGWNGPRGLVVVDGVDALRGAEDRDALSAFVTSLRESRWQVIATVRTFDARNNRTLQTAFSGLPICDEAEFFDASLSTTRHISVGDLTDRDLAEAELPTALANLVAEADPGLLRLLRNPFNLRLAAELSTTEFARQESGVMRVRSRVTLLRAYWTWRVETLDAPPSSLVITRLCREMVRSRRMAVPESEPVVTSGDAPSIRALLGANVLVTDSTSSPAGTRALSFSHNILFDYAVAVHLLLDPVDDLHLLQVLDGDAALSLVARPSLELAIDMLWASRANGAFWPLCLAVAESPHTLASLAFAGRILCLSRTPDDMGPLRPETGRHEGSTGLVPSQDLVAQLIGALRAPALLPDPAQAEIPLSRLARHLAENAGNSYADAALSANLLVALQLRLPLHSGSAGGLERARTIRVLLDACRRDPARMEDLAGVAARQLPHAAEFYEEARGALDELLSDEPALVQWGGTALTPLAECLVPAARVDVALARRIANTILSFRETRDSQVSLGASALLPLNESRKQQAGHSMYVIGEAFGELCTADLRLAADIFCLIANGDYLPDERSWWRRSGGDDAGLLTFGPELSYTPNDVGKVAMTALGVALGRSELPDVAAAVACLVVNLRNAAAWSDLLTQTLVTSRSVAPELLPALESGKLLAHGRSHVAAASLLSAIAAQRPDQGSRLESAVLAAWALIDSGRGSQQAKDFLLNSFPRELITSDLLSGRAAELGSQELPVDAEWPIDPLDEIGELAEAVDGEPRTPLAQAINRLRQAVNETRQPSSATTDLLEAFADVQVAISPLTAADPSQRRLVVEAAGALAPDARVSPNTSIGLSVFSVLTEASEDAEAGEFFD